MTTIEVALQEIAAHPDDAAPRLMLADLIEEQGHEKYAADLRHPEVGHQSAHMLASIVEKGSAGTLREFFSCIDTVRALRMTAHLLVTGG